MSIQLNEENGGGGFFAPHPATDDLIERVQACPEDSMCWDFPIVLVVGNSYKPWSTRNAPGHQTGGVSCSTIGDLLGSSFELPQNGHLAEVLQIPVLLKRASDLLDKYVGGSEKQIASAFQEAIDQEAFLILDEADSLLGDRRYAVRNWEVSQINGMLTWMESHPLPFACTTNLKERLDQASLRRFTFKCSFDYLQEAQIDLAFQHFFHLERPKGQVAPSNLTPADFSVVRKKAELLGLLGNRTSLIQLLAEEVDAKEQGAPRRVFGFTGG